MRRCREEGVQCLLRLVRAAHFQLRAYLGAEHCRRLGVGLKQCVARILHLHHAVLSVVLVPEHVEHLLQRVDLHPHRFLQGVHCDEVALNGGHSQCVQWKTGEGGM